MQLTTEQKQMVEDNLGLAYSTAYKISLKSPLEYDDILSICFLGLIKTAQKFDPSKGFAFSTYAVTTMRWMVHKEANPRKPQIKASYFEDLIPTEWESSWENIIDGENSNWESYLGSDSPENELVSRVLIEEIIKQAETNTAKKVIILRYCYPDMTQAEIGKRAGCSQRYAGMVLQDLKKRRDEILLM